MARDRYLDNLRTGNAVARLMSFAQITWLALLLSL